LVPDGRFWYYGLGILPLVVSIGHILWVAVMDINTHLVIDFPSSRCVMNNGDGAAILSGSDIGREASHAKTRTYPVWRNTASHHSTRQ
jgi:hypothetical protein